MYLRRIVLENIRGFSHLDFTLQRSDDSYAGWTVILGDNASGKTALLKSIAIALVGPDTTRTLQPSVTGWVRSGTRVGTIATQLVAGADDRFAQGRRYEKPFWSEIQLKCDDHGKVLLSQGTKYLRKGKGPTRGPWAENPEGWFCVGYGPFRRLYGHSPEAQRLMSTKGKVARFATMFREDATLAECDLWLRQLRYRALEGDGQARLILDRVLKILNHDFLQHHMFVDRVDSDGLWLRHQNGVTLSLDDMSDGYRAALAMLVDILKQLVEVYGLEGFTMSNSSEPQVTYSGVVLIDEIDAHLHPLWQRVIGEWFKRILPKIQFVVTTHSPFICQAADESGLFHLPAPGTHEEPFQLTKEDYERVISGKPDNIYLTPAFNMKHTRSPRAVRARKEYSLLQSKKNSRKLTPKETQREKQLALFVSID